MTSVMRRYSQIEPRIKYYSVIASSIDLWNPISVQSPTSSVMEATEFVGSYSPTQVSLPYQLTQFPLLQDLGRQITVYDNTTTGVVGSPHIALFRQVLWVNGLDTEGINIDASGNPLNMGYICVWTDATPYRNVPAPYNFAVAPVARTG